MATRIDEVQSYDADPDTVFAMLADEEFIVHKSTQSGSLDVTAEVEEVGDRTRIRNKRVMPAKVPGFREALPRRHHSDGRDTDLGRSRRSRSAGRRVLGGLRRSAHRVLRHDFAATRGCQAQPR